MDTFFCTAMVKDPGKKGKRKSGRKTASVRSRKKKTAKASSEDAGLAKKLSKEFSEDPGNTEAFIQLWDIYLVEEAWGPMEELLHNRIASVHEPEEKIRCLLRLASLYDEKLIEIEKAIDVYHQVINLDPKNRRAIWALGHLYHDLEDWEKVIEIYLLQISLAENPVEKLSIRAKLAQVFEERLDQHDQALMEYIRAVRLAPENVRVLLEMEKLATRTESFRELLAVYQDVVERITRVDLKTALYLKLARLYAEHLEDTERSDEYYIKALGLSEGNPEQLFSISSIYGEEEEWEELIATYTQLIRHAEQPEVKTKIRREMSRLYRDGLNDMASAFFELVRVARYNPEEPNLVQELAELGIACDKHLELAAVLEDIGARLTDEEQKAPLYTRLARLHLEDLHNAEMARTVVARVLENSPAYIPAQILRFDLLEANREYEALAEATKSFLARPDIPEDVATEQRKRLARIYEDKLGDREQAVELFRESMHSPDEADPASPEERDVILEELYRKQGTWEELVDLLNRRQDAATDQQEKLKLLFKAAEVLEEEIGDAERAAELYEDILLLEPESAPAQEALFRIHQQAELAAEPRGFRPPPPDTQVSTPAAKDNITQVDIPAPAERDQTVLDLPTPALKPARVDARPEDITQIMPPPIKKKLKLQELVEELEDELEKEAPEDLPLPPLETEEPQDHPDSSLGQEETTARIMTTNPLEAAWLAVRRDPDAVEKWEDLAGLIHNLEGEPAAFAIMEEGLRLISGEEKQARLYRRMSALAQSPELKMRLGRLLERNERLDDAESSYRAVLSQNPNHPESLDGLYRLYQSRGTLDRFDSILTRTLKAAGDPASRRALLQRRARLRADDLNRIREALDDLEQLVSADGGDLDSLIMQEEILERTGRHEELVRAYERHLEYSGDPEGRVDLLLALAILYENRLDNPEKGARFYRQALRENPEHMGAYDSLATLLEKRRDWPGAIEVLKTASQKITDPEMVSLLHYRIGKVLEEQLLRPEEAEAAYRQAVSMGPAQFDALCALKGMARRREDWVEVIRLNNQLLKIEEEQPGRLSLLTELARVWQDKLENQDKALEYYEQVVRLDSKNLDAARAVAEARLKTQRHEEAHQLLERATTLGTQANIDPRELANLHLKLAQTAEALDRPDQASEAYQKALNLAPADHSILTQFGYHLARYGRWERAVQLYQEILTRYRERLAPDEIADVHCVLAQGYGNLDRPEDAALNYRQALKANPRHVQALRSSIELARSMGRYQMVVDLLKQLREASPSPSSRLKLSAQIGECLLEKLNQPDQAAQIYQETLELEPNNIELLDRLRRVLVRADRFQEAVEVLERLVKLSSTDRRKARFLRIAGDIERERLDDESRALEFYYQTLRLTPLDRRAQTAAAKILNRRRDWRQLGDLFEELLQRIPPPIAGQDDGRVPILTELVELYRYSLDDRTSAIAACEHLLSISSGDLKVREDLARLYEAEGRIDDAIALHQSLIADSPFSVDSYHALRRIHEQRGHKDRSLCMAATLAFLDEANPDELQLLEEYGAALPIPPDRLLSEILYNRLLLHPHAGGLLGELFSFAADNCRSVLVVDHKEYKLKSRSRLKLNDQNNRLAVQFRNALTCLGVHPPEIYGKGVGVKGIMTVNTSPVAVLYSEAAVKQASDYELTFMVGRAVGFSRPENLLAAAFSPKRLSELLEALEEVAFPDSRVHPVADEVADLAYQIGKAIPSRKLSRLQQLIGRYRDQADDLVIRDWVEGVEHTCNRAGFVLCGDLEAAVEVLKGARVVSPSGSHRSLIRELIFYTISDDYFELREAVNAAID